MSNNKDYMREYMKKRWERRRIDAISVLGGKCVRCNSNSDLHFHHIDPATKLFTIARGSSFSEKRFWAEIDKCQLLCYDCHRDEHYRRKYSEHEV
jgi:5-methylcytosine-specific restriction endonuclease McrA